MGNGESGESLYMKKFFHRMRACARGRAGRERGAEKEEEDFLLLTRARGEEEENS